VISLPTLITTARGYVQPFGRAWVLPAVSGAGLAMLTMIVVVTGHLGSLDAWVIARFTPVPVSGPVHAAVTALSVTASAGVGIISIMLLGLVFAVRRRDLLPLLITGTATFLLVAGVYIGKWAVGRARPVTNLPVDPEPAFPSGHSTTSVVMVGCLVLLIGAGWTTARRRTPLVLLACYPAAIGVCRLYLGLHWLSDVLAGWLLGITIIGTVAALFGRPRKLAEDPETLPSADLGARTI
jgi:membrane-associated phospholipid phosphatase